MGRKQTEETKIKISLANTGRKHTEQTKEKLSKINMGRVLTNEQRLRISQSHKGKRLSQETREKLSKLAMIRNRRPEIRNESTEKEIINLVLNGNSIRSICKRFECSQSLINRILKDNGIKSKDSRIGNKFWMNRKGLGKKNYCNVCSKEITYGAKTCYAHRPRQVYSYERRRLISKNTSGENNPNWRGGIGKLPYGFVFNQRFKESIRNRDNNSCAICGSNNRLSIHHIDYNKLNSTQHNCITLCNSCHMKTNFNREGWIILFDRLMLEKVIKKGLSC